MKQNLNMVMTGLCLLTAGEALAAACATPPDCASLGYTMTTADCSGLNTIKCPSDPAKVWCDKPTEDGLRIGDILYSDKTTSPALVSGKTPIGIVIDAIGRIAVSLEEKTLEWAKAKSSCIRAAISSGEGSWNRTKIIYDVCSSNAPAAEFCYTHKTEGTQEGDWAIPAMNDFSKIMGNCKEAKWKDCLSVINQNLNKMNKPKLEGFWTSTPVTEYGSNIYYYEKDFAMHSQNYDTFYPVRCITHF